MALPSKIIKFNLLISDVDRGVYRDVQVHAAQHPSETLSFLVTRLIAYALHVDDGVSLSRAGLCDPEDPPLLARDLTGEMTHWVDVGLPVASRLHRATKTAQSVFVYCHKDTRVYLESLRRAVIYRGAEIEFVILPRALLNPLTETIQRQNHWTFVRTEDQLFITVDRAGQPSETFEGALLRQRIESR
jgi:uncharacterized protein YaeQ